MGNCISEPKYRIAECDIIRGVLIVFVVIGHSGEGVLHDIIFLFHMPLFFVLSGFLLEGDRVKEKEYLTYKAKKLLIPYVGYLLVDLLLVRRDYSMSSLIHAFYGGRAFSGVYWYITCFLFTLAIFSFLLKLYPDEKVKRFILIGGGAAVIESHLVAKIPFLQYPGIPWNLDVSLMALVYVGIGYFYKSLIRKITEDDSRRFDMLAVGIAIILGIFGFFNYREGHCFYYFDMKPVYYKELLGAILIPCSFGFVLVRGVHGLVRIKCLNKMRKLSELCGRATIPIMFMHMPLNHWQNTIGYGKLIYTVIGVGIPILVVIFCGRYSLMRKLFGLPKLESEDF